MQSQYYIHIIFVSNLIFIFQVSIIISIYLLDRLIYLDLKEHLSTISIVYVVNKYLYIVFIIIMRRQQ